MTNPEVGLFEQDWSAPSGHASPLKINVYADSGSITLASFSKTYEFGLYAELIRYDAEGDFVYGVKTDLQFVVFDCDQDLIMPDTTSEPVLEDAGDSDHKMVSSWSSADGSSSFQVITNSHDEYKIRITPIE